jgi:hypothetical protein
MKFLFLALLFVGSPLFAQPLPSGELTVTIMKVDIKKVGDSYDYDHKTVCETKIPFTTFDSRNSGTAPAQSGLVCKLQHEGKDYNVISNFGVSVSKRHLTPTSPAEDLLQFYAITNIYSDNHDPIPFPQLQDSVFYTRDFGIKSVILSSFPYFTCGGASGCGDTVHIQAIYDYKVNQ